MEKETRKQVAQPEPKPVLADVADNSDYKFSILYIMEALGKIQDLKENSGTIECPKCKGDLMYRRAKNGHVWGRCKTPDCISWMQ